MQTNLWTTSLQVAERSYDDTRKLGAVTRGVLWEKVFLEISRNSKENTCARVSFLIKLQAYTFFTENVRTTASSKRQVHRVRLGFIFYLQLVFLSRLMCLSIIKIIQMLMQMLMKKRATSILVFSICCCFNKFRRIEALISTKLTKMKSFTLTLRV